MVNVKITVDGNLALAALGNDIDSLKSLPTYLKVEKVGHRVDRKTGRNPFILTLTPDESTESALTDLKSENTKLKAEIKRLKAKVKKAEELSKEVDEKVVDIEE